MSILQEYAKIKKEIGTEKWDSFDTYIKTYRPDLRFDQIIYNPKNYIDFNIWFNEHIKLRKVKILQSWESTFDDFRCEALLYQGEKKLADVIVKQNEDTIYKLLETNDNSYIKENDIQKYFISYIYDNFDNYLELPKISECSKLLHEIYNSVCESESSMCHISDEDWKENYSDYTEKDINILKEEVKKYGLDNIISFDDSNYKIIGFGNLETMFNDDRKINFDKERSDFVYE